MTDSTAATVDEALGRFREMLASDGYSLSWSPADRDDRLVVRIEAGPDACADCLVPLPVMQAIISDALEPTPFTLDRIELPSSTSH